MVDELFNLSKNKNIFLTGKAGSGKSYTILKLIEKLKANRVNFLSLGSTGISAFNIDGYTIHSFFRFNIASSLEELQEVDKRASKDSLEELKKILSSLDLIIIDEISMVSSNLMEMIFYRLQEAQFRGKIIVVGDFYQLPPVIKRTNNLFDNRLYAFESDAWSRFNFKTIYLKESFRTKEREFIEILDKIRVASIDKEVIEFLDSLRRTSLDKDNPLYLYGINKKVDAKNKEMLNSIRGKKRVYKVDIDNLKKVSKDRLNSWINSLPIDSHLELKVGAKIIFTINRWGEFVNGEEGVVKSLKDDLIEIETKRGVVELKRELFELKEIKYDTKKEENKEEILAQAYQFPIKLSYALTIHKSQGMSINSLVCDIENIFAPSHFYVAISRAKSYKKLKLLYSKNGFLNYINRVVKVDRRVREFYEGLKYEDKNIYN